MTYRSSFAFDGLGGTWRYYVVEGKNIPMAEVATHARTIESAEGSIARADFVGAIIERIHAASRGECEFPGDAKAGMYIRRDINELRWFLSGTRWRLYYSEPIRWHQDRVMLGLLFNRKADMDEQDDDIVEASQRNTWCHANLMG